MRQSGFGVQPIGQRTVRSVAGTGYQVDFDPVQGVQIGLAIGPVIGPTSGPTSGPTIDATNDRAIVAAGIGGGPAAPTGAVHRSPQRSAAPVAPPDRVLLFAGHMIDKPTRAAPRFPAAQEATARQAIQAAIAQVQAGWPAGTRALGIAGGASGGDILFHEVCAELGITTALYLAMPPVDYIAQSVQVDPAIDSSPGWVARFHTIHQRCEAAGGCHLLSDGSTPPDDSIWERNNRWMLASALAHGADKLTLLVLWDGQGGDAPGGTQHMVDVAAAAGAVVRHLDSRSLFGLA